MVSENGWTIATLKVLLETEISAVKDSAAAALSASERAISKAEAGAEKRAEAISQIHSAMTEQQKSFANKGEVDMMIEALAKRVAAIDTLMATSGGKSAGIGQLWAVLSAVVITIAAIVGLFFVVIKGATP